MSRLPETGSAHLKAFAMKRAVSLHCSPLGLFYHVYHGTNLYGVFGMLNSMRTLFRPPDRLVRTRMIRRTRTRYVPNIFHVPCNRSSSTCSDTAECYCFLRLLAAVVRLHRTGTRACSLCVVPDIVTAYFVPLFFSFGSGIFWPNQPESTLEFYETSIKAAAA